MNEKEAMTYLMDNVKLCEGFKDYSHIITDKVIDTYNKNVYFFTVTYLYDYLNMGLSENMKHILVVYFKNTDTYEIYGYERIYQ